MFAATAYGRSVDTSEIGRYFRIAPFEYVQYQHIQSCQDLDQCLVIWLLRGLQA